MVMGASTGVLGTARAQYHLRQILVTLDMKPINKPEIMISGAAQRFDPQGNLTDEKTAEYIRKMLESLAAWTRSLNR